MDEGTVRILLIEDNPGDARFMRELLSEAGKAAFTVDCADRLAAALQYLSERPPDAVLLDLCLPDSKGFETFLAVRARAPELPFIILTGSEDEKLALRAVGEGAQDYLVKGRMSGPSMARCIRYAIERQKAMLEHVRAAQRIRSAKVLGFIGSKGGAGTTTVALNVAASLAQSKATVIAIELRADYGAFSLQLRQAPGRNLRGLLELNPSGITGQELMSYLVPLSFGVQVLFGPQRVEDFKEIRPEQAEAIVKAAAAISDYVVVDLPPLPSQANQAAVRNCNFVGLVVEREATSVMAGKVMADLLRSWGVNQNLLAGVVINRTPSVATFSMAEIRSFLGCGILGVVTQAAEICAASYKTGVPFAIAQPGLTPAQNLAELAQKFTSDRVELLVP